MDQNLRQRTATSLRDYANKINLDEIIKQNGSPLLVLDTTKFIDQYQNLRECLPGFNVYYVLKALSHPTVVSTLAANDRYLLPELNIGGYLLTPNMGAYSLATATDFNGIQRAKVVVVESGRAS